MEKNEKSEEEFLSKGIKSQSNKNEICEIIKRY